jgi:hypothetical protein
MKRKFNTLEECSDYIRKKVSGVNDPEDRCKIICDILQINPDHVVIKEPENKKLHWHYVYNGCEFNSISKLVIYVYNESDISLEHAETLLQLNVPPTSKNIVKMFNSWVNKNNINITIEDDLIKALQKFTCDEWLCHDDNCIMDIKNEYENLKTLYIDFETFMKS